MNKEIEELKQEINNLSQQCLICNKDRENEELKKQLAESESELEKQKEKYVRLYSCYKETLSKDLQDIYRIAEENKQLKQQFEGVEGKIRLLEGDIQNYRNWHNVYERQISTLMTELETYRPTKLEGNGQCSCYSCEEKEGFNRHWTSWCYRYKGHIYCNNCLTKIISKERSSQYEDKISFAVAELKKTLSYAEDILNEALKNSSLNNSYYDKLLDKLDNQIENLEKEKGIFQNDTERTN